MHTVLPQWVHPTLSQALKHVHLCPAALPHLVERRSGAQGQLPPSARGRRQWQSDRSRRSTHIRDEEVAAGRQVGAQDVHSLCRAALKELVDLWMTVGGRTEDVPRSGAKPSMLRHTRAHVRARDVRDTAVAAVHTCCAKAEPSMPPRKTWMREYQKMYLRRQWQACHRFMLPTPSEPMMTQHPEAGSSARTKWLGRRGRWHRRKGEHAHTHLPTNTSIWLKDMQVPPACNDARG